MKKVFVGTFAVAAFFLPGAQLAGAADDAQYRKLGQCMAYTAIKSGFDGTNAISPFAADALAQMGDEFMFEASLLNISEEDAQYFVVGRLVEFNLQVKERGAQSLIDDHETACQELAKSLSSG